MGFFIEFGRVISYAVFSDRVGVCDGFYHRVLQKNDSITPRASASEAIDALGRYAVAHGWDSQADLKEYQDWLETVDDMTGRL
jgi:hypothetical protein